MATLTDQQAENPAGATSPAPSGAAVAAIAGWQLPVALRLLIAMTVVVGIAYPAAVLGLGQLLAPAAANGSLVTGPNGEVVGSSLIGQQFDGDQRFTGRPSAAGDGYDAMSSGGSNLAADSPELEQQIEQVRADIAAANGVDPTQVPPDAVTRPRPGHQPGVRAAAGKPGGRCARAAHRTGA